MKHLTLKRLKHYSLTGGKIIFFLSVFLCILVNIFFSQSITSLYFQLVKEDKNAVVSFLNKIKNLAIFPSFLEINKKIYGNSLEQEVFAEDNKRKETIAEFETLLEKNPKSRDLLYNLYLLYYEDGNKTKAGEYLRRAKEIDPRIEN